MAKVAFLFGIFLAFTHANICPLTLSINITNGERLNDGTIVNDGISFEPKTYFDYANTIRGCVCDVRRCIRKCCPYDYIMINGTCQLYEEAFLHMHNYTNALDLSNGHFYLIYRNETFCETGEMVRLSPNSYEEDAFYIRQDGNLFKPIVDDRNHIFTFEKYCVEMFIDDEMDKEVSIVTCTDKVKYFFYGMIISMPFLLATFIVYAILPDRNLHGKALMCYVITLFGAYLLLVIIQLHPTNWNDANCKTLGLFCLFFFMVSFFWMNVMSIDIWWAFSGLRGFSGSKREAERKRFLLYSAYAWGMPLVHVILVVGLTLSTSLPPYVWYNPGMGDGQCWFRDGYPTLVYFYGPMAILIMFNITLFIITAWKIKQVQQDTAVLRKDESKKHSYENDKQRFNLYVKLMLAMGVNWSMEIISWGVNWQVGVVPAPVWYLTDFCNALYGVFIFFIFVFKRNIWKLLKRRYYMLMGKPHLARSLTQTAYSPRTTGSSVSQTVTTDTKSFVNDSSVLTSEVA